MSETDTSETKAESLPAMAGFFRGLSGRILGLTILFVMLAEVLIFVPSVANMRINWLRDKLNTAAAAAIVVDGLSQASLPRSLQDDTLMATGTKAIALHKAEMTRMIVVADMPPMVDATYDLAATGVAGSIGDAFYQLAFGGGRVMAIKGPISSSGMDIEVVMGDEALTAAMRIYARNIFLISIVISLFTGGLIFLLINRVLIRPVRLMTGSMQAFATEPENPAHIMQPVRGRDELALATRHLAAMQGELQKTLKSQKNLADLGLAVSKINHDMRNILSSAQLLSDRLADVDDPMVKGFAPKLLRTLDRAISYTSEVLAFGRASEAEPRRRLGRLAPIAEDVIDILGPERDSGPDGIGFKLQIAGDLEIDADPEQLFRILHNICRNAVEALAHDRDNAGGRHIVVSAHRAGSVVSVMVDDNGPGMPPMARENLFQPFRGSARAGGTGLGLAIARELVLAHGGTIALVEKAGRGTLFRFDIPDRPARIEAARKLARP